MHNEAENSDILKSKWLTSVVLVVALYFIYASTFLTDYLMNDEWAHIGSSSNNLLQIALNHFMFNGRPVFGVLQNWVFGTIGYDPFLAQVVRFLGFLSMAGIAVALQQFLERRSQRRWFSFFVVLFLFSQVSIQGLQGYSLLLISNSQPAIWLSLAAFYLYFFAFRERRIPIWLQVGVVFLLLLVSMHSIQTYAFFAMIPLAYLALTDWEHQKKRILSFFIISIVVFISSSVVYKFVVDFSSTHGGTTYPLAEQAFGALKTEPLKVIFNALNPFAYWNAFKLWTYPFPFHYTAPLGELKRTISSYILVVWAALIVAAIITEVREVAPGKKQQVLFKWLAVLVAMGFGALFLIADSPTSIIDHRPHMALTMTGVAIFAGAYSLQVLASRYRFWRSSIVAGVGIFLVILVAFGAQADVLRGIVYTRKAQIDFIRTALVAKDPAEYEKIIVVLPKDNGCITEPCDPWFGQAVHSEWHMKRPEVYHYALETMVISADDKEITFETQPPDTIPDDAIIIDWNQYVTARRRLEGYLHWSGR